MDKVSVIGLQVDAVDYQGALDESVRLSLEPRAAAVSASNTHIAAASRYDVKFGRIMNSFDLTLPDGMPLIWVMNLVLKRRKEARLHDRVYGPYFMKYAIEHAPKGTRHFLFGGGQDCLDELQLSMRELRSDIEIAGAYSPPYRLWTEEDQVQFAKVINEANPDFVWVALGGEKQERWIIENLCRFNRGVFFAIGDAFELLAGRRPFAPDWCQKYGVTWLYRLIQEPRRMWKRYLKYNSLFVWYVCVDALKKAFSR